MDIKTRVCRQPAGVFRVVVTHHPFISPPRDPRADVIRRGDQYIDELEDCGMLPRLAADVERELEGAGSRAGRGEVLERPSEAELAVLRLLASELSARDIGARLFLSANTVRTHTRAIYRKLGVNSRADAVARATVLGLLDEAQSPR